MNMLAKTVTVYTAEVGRRSRVSIILGLETDVDRVEALLLEALDGLDDITRIGSIRALSLDGGLVLSTRFWHPPDIQSGNDAVDPAVRTTRRTLLEAG